MGIDAQLVDERGKIEAEILDPLDLLNKLMAAIPEWETTHCIQYIDPYGDTVFNRLQMECFLDEWRNVENLAPSPDEKLQLGEIRILGVRCKNSAHLYLKFVGD